MFLKGGKHYGRFKKYKKKIDNLPIDNKKIYIYKGMNDQLGEIDKIKETRRIIFPLIDSVKLDIVTNDTSEAEMDRRKKFKNTEKNKIITEKNKIIIEVKKADEKEQKDINDFVKAVNNVLNNNENFKKALNEAVKNALPKENEYFSDLNTFANFLLTEIKKFFENAENLNKLGKDWENFEIKDKDLEKLYEINLDSKNKVAIIESFNVNKPNDNRFLSNTDDLRKAINTFKKILGKDKVSAECFRDFLLKNIGFSKLSAEDMDDILKSVNLDQKDNVFGGWKFYNVYNKLKVKPSKNFIGFMVKNTDFNALNKQYLIGNILILMKKHPAYQENKTKGMLTALQDILGGKESYEEFSKALLAVQNIADKIKLNKIIKESTDKDVLGFVQDLISNDIEIKVENSKFEVNDNKEPLEAAFNGWNFWNMYSNSSDEKKQSKDFIDFMVNHTDFNKLDTQYLIADILILMKSHPAYQKEKTKEDMLKALQDILGRESIYGEFSKALLAVPDIADKIKLEKIIKKSTNKDVLGFVQDLISNGIEIKLNDTNEEKKFEIDGTKVYSDKELVEFLSQEPGLNQWIQDVFSVKEENMKCKSAKNHSLIKTIDSMEKLLPAKAKAIKSFITSSKNSERLSKVYGKLLEEKNKELLLKVKLDNSTVKWVLDGFGKWFSKDKIIKFNNNSDNGSIAQLTEFLANWQNQVKDNKNPVSVKASLDNFIWCFKNKLEKDDFDKLLALNIWGLGKDKLFGYALSNILSRIKDGNISDEFLTTIKENNSVCFAKLWTESDGQYFGKCLFSTIYQLIRTSEGYEDGNTAAQKKAIQNVLVNGEKYKWFREGLKIFFGKAKDNNKNINVGAILKLERVAKLEQLLKYCGMELEINDHTLTVKENVPAMEGSNNNIINKNDIKEEINEKSNNTGNKNSKFPKWAKILLGLVILAVAVLSLLFGLGVIGALAGTAKTVAMIIGVIAIFAEMIYLAVLSNMDKSNDFPGPGGNIIKSPVDKLKCGSEQEVMITKYLKLAPRGEGKKVYKDKDRKHG